MKRWIVYTPEYETHAMSCDPPEPPEYGADVVEIDAETRRDALALGVKELLRVGSRYCRDRQWDGRSPYGGVKVDGPFTEADMAEPPFDLATEGAPASEEGR